MSGAEGARESLAFSFRDARLEIEYPCSLASEIGALLGAFPRLPAGDSTTRLSVREDANGLFSMEAIGPVAGDLKQQIEREAFPHEFISLVAKILAENIHDSVALDAAAVSFQDAAILVVGEQAEPAASFVSWLLGRSLTLMSDAMVALEGERNSVTGAPFGSMAGAQVCDGRLPALASKSCHLIVLPRFRADASALDFQVMSASRACFELMARVSNARNLPRSGMTIVAGLARALPCLLVEYGDLTQLEGFADVVCKFLVDRKVSGDDAREFLPEFVQIRAHETALGTKKRHPVPTTSARKADAKVTIGMATFDDYDGVYFTVGALRLYHPEVMDRTEILVIDNNPEGPCSRPLKELESWIPNYRYVPELIRTGTAQPRNLVFAEAVGEFVVCIDSHVLLAPGALRRLYDYFNARPESRDLLQGPIVADDLKLLWTHFAPRWGAGMYGVWETDPRGLDPDAPPFEIPMQGLGLFACRKDAWLGFNRRFRKFGGEEGYIHEKFRQAGARTLCLPFLRWQHRFNRPMGVPYPNTWRDRVRNYLIGYRELGLPSADMEAHFLELLGAEEFHPMLAQLKNEIETPAGDFRQ